MRLILNDFVVWGFEILMDFEIVKKKKKRSVRSCKDVIFEFFDIIVCGILRKINSKEFNVLNFVLMK